MIATGELGLGDDDADRAHAELIAVLWPGINTLALGWTDWALRSRGIDPDDEEAESLGFSWRQCDGCGSTLGGDRHAATAFDS